MEKLTIQTLNLMVRGFSNEVTVNWLASKLGISYSTLVRCKNGVWPRSVTRQAMAGVFDECRERFFNGDGDAIARCALGYLEREGVDASPYAAALESGGYGAFVSALIDAAHDPGAVRDEGAEGEGSAGQPDSPGEGARSNVSKLS